MIACMRILIFLREIENIFSGLLLIMTLFFLERRFFMSANVCRWQKIEIIPRFDLVCIAADDENFKFLEDTKEKSEEDDQVFCPLKNPTLM